jgi:peptide deformylase
MAKLTILEYPDPRLRTKAQPVAVVDDQVRKLVDDMFETMYASKGIGLAATQVDVHQRVLVTDVSSDRSEPRVFINAQIIEREGSTEAEEGCLSVPGIYDKVERAEKVSVRYLDLEGRQQTLEAEGLLAVCIQHEIDHLHGKVFVDHLSMLKQMRIKSKLAKQARITA